ncbi:MAG TPA: hypothetical protein VJB64_03720 [Patescibacteria group bacterium]|nr:hypothetical protein [Patescibacteria group bacterium]
MRTTRPKPQSLRPLSVKHRRWFLVLMFAGIVIIATGWLLTIRDLAADIPAIKTSIEEGVDQAVEEIQDARLDPGEQVDEAAEAFEALKDGYEAEKQRQETSPEDEPSYE